MSTEKHDRLEKVFSAARELPQSERSGFLNRACGDDEALREEVEQLLRASDQPDSFLDQGGNLAAISTEGFQSEFPETGTAIRGYKLLQRIGEGGFGAVFMAEQFKPVKRKVALKVIKPGMDSKTVVARFEAERQALAIMDHSNIARVFDGGTTENGRPFFVMELVKGVPITEYCDANKLTTTERLELFVDVCSAVQHAHHKGIIHRDLKPSNIMVTLHDGKPVIKVIDFGVAKAINQQLTERTLFTAYGQMVGTPQYMSPEQAEISGLDIDTRSDVYSLGVILYELLTGSTPLELKRLREAGFAEMQRLIRDDEPPIPSNRLSSSGEQLTIIAKHRSVSPEVLHRAIRGDLDWIVMTALAKERERRFASPDALAADINRFTTNQPIEARPPSTLYQMQKFVGRHAMFVRSIAVVVVALVGGTADFNPGLEQSKITRPEPQEYGFSEATSTGS